MSLIDKAKAKVRDMVEPEETVIHEVECEDCGTTFMSPEPPSEAVCEECGSEHIREEGRMYSGTGGPGG